jgi:hypothetical protein
VNLKIYCGGEGEDRMLYECCSHPITEDCVLQLKNKFLPNTIYEFSSYLTGNTMKNKSLPNTIYEFSSYLTGNTMKNKFLPNTIYEFSSYLTGNTMSAHYKDELVNVGK